MFKLLSEINITFNNKRVMKEVGISVDGRKKIRIKELDKEETDRQKKIALSQTTLIEEFEKREMNHKYPWSKQTMDIK